MIHYIKVISGNKMPAFVTAYYYSECKITTLLHYDLHTKSLIYLKQQLSFIWPTEFIPWMLWKWDFQALLSSLGCHEEQAREMVCESENDSLYLQSLIRVHLLFSSPMATGAMQALLGIFH